MTRFYLNDLTPGSKYALEVRARGGTDVTAWSKKFVFTTASDDVAPLPPTNLILEDYGTSFMAMWDAPTENTDGSPLKDLKDYEVTVISRGQSAKFYVPTESFHFDTVLNTATFGEPRSTILLEVRARDRNDNISSALSMEGSSTPPPEVTRVRGEGGIDTIYVYWDDLGNDIDYYEVYAGAPGFTPGEANLKGRTRGMSTAFIVPSGFYSIKVRAVNRFELAGPFNSDEVIVGTIGADAVVNDTVAPVIPKDLVLSMNLYNNGLLRTARLLTEWSPVPDEDVAGYNIRIRPVNTDQWTAVTVDRSITRHVFTGLLEDTFYEGSVSAFDRAGNTSPWSNIVVSVNKATDEVPPVAPIMFTPRIEPGVIEWRWSSPIEPDIKEHLLEVATDANMTQNVQTFRVSGNSYVFTGTPGTTYWGRVVAVDIKGLASLQPADDSNKRSTIPSAVPSTYIANLEADKITAGQGFLNALEIGVGGSIASKNFGTNGGFKLTDAGFSLTKGEINLGTATSGFVANADGDVWTGGITGFGTSPWRVDRDGNMRIGGDGKFYIASNGDMWVGATTAAAAPWRVYADGSATFNKTTLTGDGLPNNTSLLNAGGKFYVWKNSVGDYQVNLAGNMYLDSGGNLNVSTGNVNLNGGWLNMSSGGMDIYGGSLYLRSSSMYLSGGTLDITGGQLKCGDTYNGVFFDSSGIKLYRSGSEVVNITRSGNLKFAGDITGSNGTFYGTMSANNISSGTITGSTFQTRSSGSRVVMGGNADWIAFYNSNNQSTFLQQGLTYGLETSGSLRLGNNGSYSGTGTLYAGDAVFQYTPTAAGGYTMFHGGNIFNPYTWSGASQGARGGSGEISYITTAAQSDALGTVSAFATIGHVHPHPTFASSSREYKQDISRLDLDALKFVQHVEPYAFRYKESPAAVIKEDDKSVVRFGTIVETLPWFLRLPDDRNAIDVVALSVLNSAAINQLSGRIRELEAEVDRLREESV